MKRLSLFVMLVLTHSFAASADEPSPEAKAADALVQRTLIAPLAAKEDKQSKFSRARMPPRERRVRILDEAPRRDLAGGAFLRFAVDERFGLVDDEEGWSSATITGCVYVGKGSVYVQRGEQYRPAAFLLGKNLKAAAAHTCQTEPQS